jgi:hypothetical protein
MEDRRPPLAWLILFITLSLTDLVLTFLVVIHGGGQIEEGNPIAAAWLRKYGWPGLIIFKSAAMSVVIVVTLLVNSRKPGVARGLLAICCAVMAAVALYSYSMFKHLP